MSDLFGNDYDGRKAIPIFEGVLMYFPKAIAAVAEVSEAGNRQHNPGQPLHWARGKSMDQYNTALRHMMDHRMGGGRIDPKTEGQEINNGWQLERKDKDGVRHLAKAAWRVLAALQLAIEEEEAEAAQCGQSAANEDFEKEFRGMMPGSAEPGGLVQPAFQGRVLDDIIHRTCQCGARGFTYHVNDIPPNVIVAGKTHNTVKCV